ncbi:nitrate- and nitrite sensing domain-containing protein [Micromonospora sp. WMMD1120]|uniref:sensor histidine kinase n=1 Tax=Micromonospora sp. WMMD1120 TaxID=3016106 RepID=UPI00241620DC|nr:nitrate- and nitrite sensing domain-containing protein [Micromonospora sp. WMMD1120]MDG4811203.1 nitrate- and nitrite sensing domain-containing protein [Micromonospora sp. WMMD1120]
MARGSEPANGAVSNHRRRRFDVRVVPHRRRSPFRLRDWRMSTKLATVLVVPSMAFLLLAGVQTNALVGRTTALNDFSGQVGIGRQITAAVHQLQQERDRSAGELSELRQGGDRQAAASSLRQLQASTDKAIVDLRRAAEPLADADASWRVAFSQALEAYDQVVDVRPAIPPAVLSSNTILGNYNRAVSAMLDLLAEPTPGQNQPALNDAVLRYVQLARVKELSSQVRAQLYAAARAGRYSTEDRVTLTDLRAQQLTALGAFRVAATAEQVRRYDETSLAPLFVAATRLEERSLPASGAAREVLPSEQWWEASQQRQELLRQIEAGVLDDAVRQAEDASSGQLRATLLVVGGVVTVLLVALLISLLVGRSVARSMRLLRSQALKIAQDELPDTLDRLKTVTGGVPSIEVAPAVVRSLDEIGELAEAFVAVHRSAVTVAVEQALMRRNVNAMFVNLARRSQVLVERQLELLDDLEREESDPDQLENLFKLDHLAARMRRNDESLLVLAGTESTRRWNRPAGLGAVLLAAAAEIEQYQRVRIESVADVYVVGHAVGELVHLLAELLENATVFSRPDTAVVVTARAEGAAAVIEIADRGLGMSPTALEQANTVLSSPPAADVAAVERMGLFVVSHLASRLGVQVRLHGGEGGLVARLGLPPMLLATPGQGELDQPAPARMLATSAARGMVAPATAGLGGAARDLPVAGRPPVAAVPRQGRPVPVRAEDVLTPAATRDGGGWYSRQGPSTPAAPPPVAPPTIPVTAGTNERGLPVRVPMAQLSAVTRSAQPTSAPTRTDPDPEAVGGMLSRLYSGVRRAEAEDTTEIPVPPSGGHDEGGRRQ